jgi:hypothetical protein
VVITVLKYLLPLIITNMEAESFYETFTATYQNAHVIIPEDPRLKVSPFSQCSQDYFRRAVYIPLHYNIKLRFLL